MFWCYKGGADEGTSPTTLGASLGDGVSVAGGGGGPCAEGKLGGEGGGIAGVGVGGSLGGCGGGEFSVGGDSVGGVSSDGGGGGSVEGVSSAGGGVSVGGVSSFGGAGAPSEGGDGSGSVVVGGVSVTGGVDGIGLLVVGDDGSSWSVAFGCEGVGKSVAVEGVKDVSVSGVDVPPVVGRAKSFCATGVVPTV
jgi:hypothetical protein